MRRSDDAILEAWAYRDLGDEGARMLRRYGRQREREGFGLGLLVSGFVVALVVALWPLVGWTW